MILLGVEVGVNVDSSSVCAEDHRHWQVGMVERVQGLTCSYTRGKENETTHLKGAMLAFIRQVKSELSSNDAAQNCSMCNSFVMHSSVVIPTSEDSVV